MNKSKSQRICWNTNHNCGLNRWAVFNTFRYTLSKHCHIWSNFSSSSLGAQLDILSWGQSGCFSKTAPDHQSAKVANLQPPCNSTTTTITDTLSQSQCTHTLYLHSLYLSLSLSFSLAGCEDASSTLQWRQIRPPQPCHSKTSPRKVATSSPFQLIYRHSVRGEEEGSPCSSITNSSTLSQEKNQKMIWMENELSET